MPPALPKPGTLRWSVLEWAERNDGATVGELADALLPVPRFQGPVRDGRHYRHRQAVRAQHRAESHRRIRLELSALQRHGLVESAGPVMLEGWAADLWLTDPGAVMRHVYDTGFVEHFDGDQDPDEVEGEVSPDMPMAWRIVAALAERPHTRADLCRAATGRSRECGAFERAYNRLAERGVIVIPSLRRVTNEGRAWLAEERTDV